MQAGLLGIEGLDRAEIEAILARAKAFQPLQTQSLKKLDTLRGKMIVNLFYEASTRTRSAFEVASFDQGAQVSYIGPSGSHIGYKESMKDTARVLGRMYDAIEYRGFSQEDVDILAEYAGVPIWNGLTDDFHPTQILADFLTMQEHSPKPLSQIAYCFLGDSGNNMGNFAKYSTPVVANAQWTGITLTGGVLGQPNHLNGKNPAGGNIAFLDGHAAWRKFREMSLRSDSGAVADYWY